MLLCQAQALLAYNIARVRQPNKQAKPVTFAYALMVIKHRLKKATKTGSKVMGEPVLDMLVFNCMC